MSYTILVNSNAGTVNTQGRDNVLNAIQNALPDAPSDQILFVDPQDFPDLLKSIEPDGKLLIGGGDGTLLTAATILRQRNIPFGPLPFGTLNLLCKDLGLPDDYARATAAYKDHDTIKIDMGTVNDEPFLCAVMIGITTSLTRYREQHRHESGISKWLTMLHKLIRKLATEESHEFVLKLPNLATTQAAKAVIVTNNLYSDNLTFENPFKKRTLGGGKLGLYTVNTQGTLDSINLLFALATGRWQDDASIQSNQTVELEINSDKKQVPVAIDGELKTLQAPLRFRVIPQALSLLVPRDADEKT